MSRKKRDLLFVSYAKGDRPFPPCEHKYISSSVNKTVKDCTFIAQKGEQDSFMTKICRFALIKQEQNCAAADQSGKKPAPRQTKNGLFNQENIGI